MLSAPFRSESRAKIKDAFIRGKDYLMMKVQDYQQKIRSNMNNKLESNHPSSSVSDQYQPQQELSEIMNCTLIPAGEKHVCTAPMQDNREWPSDNLAKIHDTVQPSTVYEPKVNKTASPCKKVSHDVPPPPPPQPHHCVDDLPLGVEANTLNEIPACKMNEAATTNLNETPGNKRQSVHEPPDNDLTTMALTSVADNREAKPLEDSTYIPEEKLSPKDDNQVAINPKDKTQQWLHTLAGKQQSFGSDLSVGTNASSIELLLQGREADPEEILRNLGFGSCQNAGVRARIPPRFFSDSRFCIEDFRRKSELQELVDSWKCEKNSSDQLSQHPQISPYLPQQTRFLPSMLSCPNSRSLSTSCLDMTQSILTPDNQMALAAQGFYEYTQNIGSLLKVQPQKSVPLLPASERRKNYRSTRTQQTWSLIEPEPEETETEILKSKQNKTHFGVSVDSALSSDIENSSDRKGFNTSLHRQTSKDSESSNTGIRDIRTRHVNKLMSYEETDDDYEVFSPLEDNYSKIGMPKKSYSFQDPKSEICDNIKRSSSERELFSSSMQTLVSSSESGFDSDIPRSSKSTEPAPSAAPVEESSDDTLTAIFAEEDSFSDHPTSMREILRPRTGAVKRPSIYRFGSAQSDSSGYVEPDTLPAPSFDALSVNDAGDRGSHDGSETNCDGMYKRHSINSDTTIKDLAASSSSSSFQCPCDKSVGTEPIIRPDRAVSTEHFSKQAAASQTDSCCFCSWCINSNQVCAHLHSTVPYQSTVSTEHGMSLHIDASQNFALIANNNSTSGSTLCSTSRTRETSFLNLFISDGRILFCDNDSNNTNSRSISSSNNNNQKLDSDNVDNSRRPHHSFRELESAGTNCEYQNDQYRSAEDSSSTFCLLNNDRSLRYKDNISKNVIEYKKLLKLTNRKTFMQTFVNNPFLPYTPHIKVEIWAEKPVDMHLQEENQLMQHAVQRYKFDLQIMESTFLSCFNHMADKLSKEETLMMDELYELWTAVSIEVSQLERLLAERRHLVRKGNCQLTTLTSLQVIPLMTEILKEQLCAFQMNSDIFEMTMTPRNPSPAPVYHRPEWPSLNMEMQNLRSQITGHNNMQAVHLNRSMEELKESMMVEIQQNITQNFNRLFMG
ncbi:uncharacterized protein LOC115215466 [Argonauta hians]